jgi:hypothetical protein
VLIVLEISVAVRIHRKTAFLINAQNWAFSLSPTISAVPASDATQRTGLVAGLMSSRNENGPVGEVHPGRLSAKQSTTNQL